MTDFELKRPENGIERKHAEKATYYLQYTIEDGRGEPSLKIAEIKSPDVECARLDALEIMKKEKVTHGFLTLDVGEVRIL